MSIYYAHDADGAPPAPPRDPYAMAVHVRGGAGASQYDTEELAEIEHRLDAVRTAGGNALGSLGVTQRDVALDADLAPVSAARVHDAIDDARYGPSGLERFREEVDELRIALRYARMTYEEAELAATTRLEPVSALAYFRAILDPNFLPRVVGRTIGNVLLMGRLPGRPPGGPLGWIASGVGEAVNWMFGDDNLPPDAIAFDRAVRELGEGGQHIVPWFLVPGPFTYDGRTVDADLLTDTQRLLVPLILARHRMMGAPLGGPLHELDVLTVTPAHEVPVTPDLPTTIASLHAIHIDNDIAPGSIQVRRIDHPDGTRTWTLLLPSTQEMALGGLNPVDNLTNVEAYSGLVSDVEIGAVRALDLAGVAPGEEIAVVGYSQGGLTAMALAADPIVRSRFSIRAVITAGSPVGHLPTPAETEVLNLEHMEDIIVGLDGTANPEELHRTTVSRSLTTGADGELDFRVPLGTAHSIDAYAETADLALRSGDRSVAQVNTRLGEITGGPGARVTATTYQIERAGSG